VATATFAFLQGLGMDGAGNVYLADRDKVRKITAAGLVSTLWTAPGSIAGPLLPGLTVDTAGTVYAINGEGLIFKITPDGIGTTLNGPAGLCNSLGSFRATGIAPDANGNLYVAEAGNSGDQQIAADTCPDFESAFMPYFMGNSSRVSRITPDGQRTTVIDGIPSVRDPYDWTYGAADVALLDNTVYALFQAGG